MTVLTLVTLMNFLLSNESRFVSDKKKHKIRKEICVSLLSKTIKAYYVNLNPKKQ